MSHEIVVRLQRLGGLGWKAICTEPEDADCRTVCPECESWAIKTDEEGKYHEVETFNGPKIKHRMETGHTCTVCEWLNADQDILQELYEGEEFTLAQIPIKPKWEDSDMGYLWEREK